MMGDPPGAKSPAQGAASMTHCSHPPKASNVKRVTPWSYIVWWYALLGLHLVGIGYYGGSAWVYLHIQHTTLSFQLDSNSIGIPESEYVKVAIVHAVIAAIHGLFALLMIGVSLNARQLLYSPDFVQVFTKVKTKIKTARHMTSISPDPRISSLRTSSMASASRLVLTTTNNVFGRQGLFGVDFAYFDHLLLVRELVEVTLQTYQAYRMTRLLNRLWLVRSYVILLVANCWVVPILHRIYARRHRLRRMMALLCDVVLDVVSSIGISFVIFCSYAPQYKDPRFGFPLYNWYDDEWFVNLVQEFQIMMVVSWGDMASRLVFAAGVIQGMESLKEMLTDSLAAKHSPQVNRIAIGPNPPCSTSSSSDTAPSARKAQASPSRMQRVFHVLIHFVGPALFVIWGILILVVHTYAELHTVDLPCRIPLRPWLSTTPACSLAEIDCHERNSSGAGESLGDVWTVFNPALAAGLFIRHCPDLRVPPSMTSYMGLTTIKMYNTTITSWTIESGLSSSSHLRLRTLFLIRTNFMNAQLPPGLTRSDFPREFGAIFISKSNLVSIPANIDSVWPQGITISIEEAALTSIPDSIIRARPGLLSFSRCPIAHVPASLFEIPTLLHLFLSWTEIQELPRDVTKPANLITLYFAGTNVSTLWPWVDGLVKRSLFAHTPLFLNAVGTPFCAELEQILNGTRDRFTASSSNTTELASLMDVSTPSRLDYTRAAVMCISDFDTIFPRALQDRLSGINGIAESS